MPPAGSLSQPTTNTYERCVQNMGKPHIWYDARWQDWACWQDSDWDSPYGIGKTPQEAYQDWCLGMLTYEAQKRGLYAAPEEAQ